MVPSDIVSTTSGSGAATMSRLLTRQAILIKRGGAPHDRIQLEL